MSIMLYGLFRPSEKEDRPTWHDTINPFSTIYFLHFAILFSLQLVLSQFKSLFTREKKEKNTMSNTVPKCQILKFRKLLTMQKMRHSSTCHPYQSRTCFQPLLLSPHQHVHQTEWAQISAVKAHTHLHFLAEIYVGRNIHISNRRENPAHCCNSCNKLY